LLCSFFYRNPAAEASFTAVDQVHFMTAIAISNVIGSPVSGAIMQYADGLNGWRGWQWLFLLEGIPSVIIGVMVLLPFLIIDLVTSAALMSMGMMMLPPVMISLPFKILLFVLVDGWSLIITALVGSYG